MQPYNTAVKPMQQEVTQVTAQHKEWSVFIFCELMLSYQFVT